jgi:hypothetical protein|tara:strand:- start:276 stop:644 length:369 start_codon:yes stop_codon:yes gene_type:complete
MWEWIKDKWELVASGLVVLFVFILGRKKQVAAEEMVEDIIETKEKEAEVIKKIAGQERLNKALARKKYSESKLALIKQRATAQSDLEKQTIERKLELIELAKENPDEIDKILMEEFNIARLK